jgi:hypothetical protein
MIQALGKRALGEAKFRSVTALPEPQVRALLQAGKLQRELFDDPPAEVEVSGQRYVPRCHPQTQARERARRADQGPRVQGRLRARNAAVEKKPRCQPARSLRAAQGWVKQSRLGGWVRVRWEGRAGVWAEEEAARPAEAQLDGGSMIERDRPVAAASTQAVQDR